MRLSDHRDNRTTVPFEAESGQSITTQELLRKVVHPDSEVVSQAQESGKITRVVLEVDGEQEIWERV